MADKADKADKDKADKSVMVKGVSKKECPGSQGHDAISRCLAREGPLRHSKRQPVSVSACHHDFVLIYGI